MKHLTTILICCLCWSTQAAVEYDIQILERVDDGSDSMQVVCISPLAGDRGGWCGTFYSENPCYFDGTRIHSISLTAGARGQVDFVSANRHAFISTFVNGSRNRSYRWHQGRLLDLGTLGAHSTIVWDINDAGEAVGASPDGSSVRWFWWNEVDGIQDSRNVIGHLLPRNTRGHSLERINNRGDMSGGFRRRNQPPDTRAFLVRNGQFHDCGTLGGDVSSPTAINEDGWVVGFSQVNSQTYHAFLWRPGQGMIDLTPSGALRTAAKDVNNNGVIVGDSGRNESEYFAFIWDMDRGLRKLNDLIPTAAGIHLHRVSTITDDGRILAHAKIAGIETNILLTPLRSVRHISLRVTPLPQGLTEVTHGDSTTVMPGDGITFSDLSPESDHSFSWSVQPVLSN